MHLHFLAFLIFLGKIVQLRLNVHMHFKAFFNFGLALFGFFDFPRKNVQLRQNVHMHFKAFLIFGLAHFGEVGFPPKAPACCSAKSASNPKKNQKNPREKSKFQLRQNLHLHTHNFRPIKNRFIST